MFGVSLMQVMSAAHRNIWVDTVTAGVAFLDKG
jgi:hypothetical protein